MLGFELSLGQALFAGVVVPVQLPAGRAGLDRRQRRWRRPWCLAASFGLGATWCPARYPTCAHRLGDRVVALATFATATVSAGSVERRQPHQGDRLPSWSPRIIVGAGILGFDAIMKLQKWLTVFTIVATVLHALTLDHVSWWKATSLPGGGATAVVGALVMVVNRSASAGSTARPTTPATCPARPRPGESSSFDLGASLPVVILVVYGGLSAPRTEARRAISAAPIGALTTILPTSYLIPFALVAIGGLISGAVSTSTPRPDAAGARSADAALSRRRDRRHADRAGHDLRRLGDQLLLPVPGLPGHARRPDGRLVRRLPGRPAAAEAPVDEANCSTPRFRRAAARRGGTRCSSWPSPRSSLGLVTNAYAGWLKWQGCLLGPSASPANGAWPSPRSACWSPWWSASSASCWSAPHRPYAGARPGAGRGVAGGQQTESPARGRDRPNTCHSCTPAQVPSSAMTPQTAPWPGRRPTRLPSGPRRRRRVAAAWPGDGSQVGGTGRPPLPALPFGLRRNGAPRRRCGCSGTQRTIYGAFSGLPELGPPGAMIPAAETWPGGRPLSLIN